ncbi:MAG: flavin reductase [Oscillospiraceae bacterium]|nr:flavin reductase [Oscillospiraceae bacterium]
MDTKAMRKLTYGLFALSARDGDKDNACIINTAVQVTTKPSRITITVNKDNYTHDMILKTGEFNLSVLSEDAPFSFYQHFGMRSGRDVDKFADYKAAYRMGNGIYYLPEFANAVICCKVISSMDMGTHTQFYADVTDCEVLDTTESATYAYYQSTVKSAPAESSKKGWRCTVCGYIYEGDELPPDFKCPLCNHGVEDFEKIV